MRTEIINYQKKFLNIYKIICSQKKNEGNERLTAASHFVTFFVSGTVLTRCRPLCKGESGHERKVSTRCKFIKRLNPPSYKFANLLPLGIPASNKVGSECSDQYEYSSILGKGNCAQIFSQCAGSANVSAYLCLSLKVLARAPICQFVRAVFSS